MDNNKRKHIIETAMKLFNENGFHATPTSKIAKKSKVSVGTLFNYFPTKEDLIEAIYIEIKLHSKDEFLDHLEESLTEYDMMQSMWRSIILWGIEYPEEFKYLGLFTHSPFQKLHTHEKLMENYTKLREALLHKISPSPVCAKYPEFSIIYMSNSFTAATEFILKNNIEDLDDFINSSFDLFWNGFSKTSK